jgi:HAMP domain-containing protein
MGWFIGRVDPAYLWGTPDQKPLLSTMRFDVVNAAARVISSRGPWVPQLPDGVRTRFDGNTAGTFDWEVDDVEYLAAYAPLADMPELAVPLWTLIVSEARDAVVAPMDDFKRTFPVVIALSLLAALVLSLSQLRRSLAPLEALQEGTRRLAARQFDQPVAVSSRDEFAEVAASFNAMTDQIQRQFALLSTSAEIDRAVLSSVDTHRIVQTVLERMRDVCPCDVVGVTLLDPHGTEDVMTFVGTPETTTGIVTWGGWLGGTGDLHRRYPAARGERRAPRLAQFAGGTGGEPAAGPAAPLSERSHRSHHAGQRIHPAQSRRPGPCQPGGGPGGPGAHQRTHGRSDPAAGLPRQSYRPA